MDLDILKSGFLDELQKIAADLNTSGREHIKAKNFALTPRQSDTGKPAYPIHDKAHAANALARVKQHGTPAQQSEVYKDVARRYPELAARSDVPALKAKAKHAGSLSKLRPEAAELAGLGVLAVPGLDTVQAKIRSRKNPHDWEKKRLMGEGTHAALDVAGLGVLGADTVRKALRGH